MPDQEIEINGGTVVYEFVGPEDGEVVVVTPGGRFSKDYGGVHELADALAAGGKRVLLWDRPNCGRSDIQLYGKSESHMRGETLGLMLEQLGIDRVVALGGSGGARDMIVFALMYPEKVRKLGLWCIVGGSYATMNLARVYVMEELKTVRAQGIEAVAGLKGATGFGWAGLIEANPRNRERLLSMGSDGFERLMDRWLEAYIPKPNEAVPGVADWELKSIDIPTLIIRGGERDFDHPKRTSYEVHSLIPTSTLIEPPWPEDSWETANRNTREGKGFLFDYWQLSATDLLNFIDAN
jgi:pimeloyl-ACP methyl ester carboxylesterase